MTAWIHARYWGRWPSRFIIWATCPCRKRGAIASWSGGLAPGAVWSCDSCGRQR